MKKSIKLISDFNLETFYNFLNQKINNSKLYIVPNAKHMATFERADLVNVEIDKFIN